MEISLETSSQQPKDQNYAELYESCILARNQLVQTANEYRKKAKQPLIEDVTTIKDNWEELDEGVQAACRDLQVIAAREKKPQASTVIGKVGLAFRSLCRHANLGQTLFSLVPNDAFGFSSVLFTGFRMVFSAMHETALYRDAMLKALEELPCVLEDSRDSSKSPVYMQDEGLHRRCSAVFAAVFDTLRQILLWFVKNSFVTSIKLVVDPTGFSQKLSERMADVRLKSQHFWHQVEKISCSLHVQTAKEVHAIARRTELMELEITRMKLATMGMLEKLDTQPNAIAPAGTSTKNLNTDELLSRLQELAIFQQRTSPRPPSPLPLMINLDALLGDFGYDPDMLNRDCEDIFQILRPSRRHNSAQGEDFEEERVVAMQTNPRIRAWLVLNRPSILFLNSRSGAPLQPRSEVSLVCAKITTRLLEIYESQHVHPHHQAQPRRRGRRFTPFIIPLTIFCGQHHRSNSFEHTATGMLLNLLLQLVDRGSSLFQPSLGEDPILGEQFQALLNNPDDLELILTMFQTLLEKLQGGNIFIVLIIDGLKFFSRANTRRELATREAIEGLVSIFREQVEEGSGPTLKFLFTTTARLEGLEYLFDEEEEILHVPRVIRDTGSDDDPRWKRPMELEF